MDGSPWYLQRKPFITAGIAVHTLFTTYLEYKWWWEGNYHPFRFENDGFWHNYSLGVDKIGHFYTSYAYTTILYELFRWGGYSELTAQWWSSGISFFYALSIEIGDGFSTYAFSMTDLNANILGIGYAYLQRCVPFFNNFKFKWSYYPSGIIPFDRHFRITDDYDGHLYWLTIDVYNLLPEKVKSYWVPFLNIAIGYGGENISSRPHWVSGTPIYPPGVPSRKFVIALDYNLATLPVDHDTWKALVRVLDLYHFPAPGIRKVLGKPAHGKWLVLY
ncbi:MAG: YfiM family protein [Bacteroidetes bacterium]|nr:YfiM family protein [Bacteroidota bacterium]